MATMHQKKPTFEEGWISHGLNVKEGDSQLGKITMKTSEQKNITGRERLIRSHSSARFSFKLSGNSN